MDIQVHAIKYYNFWRPKPADEEEEFSQQKKHEESQDGFA